MLLRFGTSNHQSLRDYQEINFTATSLKDYDGGLLPISSGGDHDVTKLANSRSKQVRVVPVVAVYGANASGKSTLLKALDFMVQAIVWSYSRTAASEGTPFSPFLLDNSSRNSISSYDIDFVIDDTRFHYGFTLDSKRITSEWLYSFPIDKTRQTRTILFHRDSSSEDEYYFGKQLKGDNKRIGKLVRPNSLFITVAAQNSHATILPIYDFFYKKITRRIDQNTAPDEIVGQQLFKYLSDNPDLKSKVISFLKAADIGIFDIDFSKVPLEEKTLRILDDFEQILSKHLDDKELVLPRNREKTKVELLHTGADGNGFPISLSSESSGTISLLQLLGPVFSRLNEGGVLLVDELNIMLHPLVSRELIKLFSTPETNPGKAQLIFSTHDTNILVSGLLRRDQIWFAEKDTTGATSIYPLSDIKIRNTDNLEKGYIEGRFGAIPVFGLKACDYRKIGSANSLNEDRK